MPENYTVKLSIIFLVKDYLTASSRYSEARSQRTGVSWVSPARTARWVVWTARRATYAGW